MDSSFQFFCDELLLSFISLFYNQILQVKFRNLDVSNFNAEYADCYKKFLFLVSDLTNVKKLKSRQTYKSIQLIWNLCDLEPLKFHTTMQIYSEPMVNLFDSLHSYVNQFFYTK